MENNRKGLMLGRGRARGTVIYSRKPDVENFKIEKEEDALSDIIMKIFTVKDDLNSIVHLCSTSLTTAENLQKLANFIHSRCLEEEEFIPSGTTLCCKLALIEKEDVKFRKFILNILQDDFEDRDRIRKKSKKVFMNCVHFLCRIFNEMRLPDGSSYEVFAIPILTYFRTLIGYDSTEEEIKLFTILMKMCGKELELKKPGEVDVLMQDVRLKIIDNTSNRNEKACLLQLLELNINSWQPLSESIEEFYCNINA